MPLYFFHLRDGEDSLLDPDGIELADAAAIERHTLHCARSLLAAEAMRGRLPLYWRLDVKDGEGRIVHSLRFEDAVTIISPER